jgi:Flp pilus assembly protein CpaB
MAIVGLACVVLGAFAFLLLHMRLDHRVPVLVVARPVAAGEVVKAEDVRIVRMSSDLGAATIPASGRSGVVGRTAAVGLVPGSVLAPSQLGASSSLQAGQAVVGIALKVGQAPAGLRAGSRVQVVDTGSGGAGSTEQLRPVVLSNSAVVASVGRVDGSSSGVTLASLTVSEREAMSVVAAASAGRVSLVLLPGAS